VFAFAHAYSPELNKVNELQTPQALLAPADYVCDRTLTERVLMSSNTSGTEYTITFG
jgi:hypothetical protein